MTEAYLNHCQVVGRSLAGGQAADEQTFASLAVLAERLDRLKKSDKIFSSVEFSPDVKRLKSRRSAMAVG